MKDETGSSNVDDAGTALGNAAWKTGWNTHGRSEQSKTYGVVVARVSARSEREQNGVWEKR